MDPETVDPTHSTSDLLRSLKASILRLRQKAEELREQLERLGPDALEEGEQRQVAKLDSLIRDCQKVEKTLAEQTQGTNGTDNGINLDEARAEVTRRLSRLRAAAIGAEPDRHLK